MHELNKSYCIATWQHRITFIQFDDDDNVGATTACIHMCLLLISTLISLSFFCIANKPLNFCIFMTVYFWLLLQG